MSFDDPKVQEENRRLHAISAEIAASARRQESILWAAIGRGRRPTVVERIAVRLDSSRQSQVRGRS